MKTVINVEQNRTVSIGDDFGISNGRVAVCGWEVSLLTDLNLTTFRFAIYFVVGNS